MASASGDGPARARRRAGAARSGAAARANPTPRRLELGLRLRQLRNQRELTLDQVAAELLVSPTKISRLETGARPASQRDVRDLCELYAVRDKAVIDELMELARLAREPGWWKRFEDLGTGVEPLLGLEQTAVAATSFAGLLVPGLLQTADYARAAITGIEREMESRIIEERVEARLLRQEILDRPEPLRLRALIDESVIYRNIGGLAIMRGQLDRLLGRASSANVSIQIIPFSAERYAAIDSNFSLMEFEEGSPQVPVIHVETLASQLIVDRQPDVAKYRQIVENLREAALSTHDSLRLVRKIRDREVIA